MHARNKVLAHDRSRHRPKRIEIDLDDLAVDLGRRPVRLADDAGVARHRNLVLDRLDARRRNIADHIARTEIAGERLEPLDVYFELVAPGRRRNVHGVEGSFMHHAIDGQAVARLEAAHRLLEIGIINVVLDRAGMGIEIARNGEPRAQFGDALVLGAELQFEYFRDFRSAAAGNDAVIGFDRAPGRFRRSGRQHRDRRFRHVHRARRLIEALTRVAAIDVADQGIERSILRECLSACGQCRHPGKP